MPETPGHVALRHKSGATWSAVVPVGTSEDEVVAAWGPMGWSRATNSKPSRPLDLSAPSVEPDNRPAEPDTTITKEK